ncbi:MAG: triphosphoribosyl-dephospho-CoA synthase [Candidatus Bathyarchaeia archaeon]
MRGKTLQTRLSDKAKHIAKCLELAILLEASTHKPGNVSVVTNFENTRYEHFLASAVAAASSFEFAAEQGTAILDGTISASEAGVGRIIKDCVVDVDSWQRGGNTLLGTVLLFVPIAVAAGMTKSNNGCFGVAELRRNLKFVVESTTPEDAVNVYEAIGIAKPNGLGKVPELDVKDENSKNRILVERISLFEVFKIAAGYDLVCSEWVNNYPVTFDVAYPYLTEKISETRDVYTATIQTFLKVLAEYPDTFIARKAGVERARQVSLMAKEIVQLGGSQTEVGRKSLKDFDSYLRGESNLLNPGTTADILASALALCILSGYRP